MPRAPRKLIRGALPAVRIKQEYAEDPAAEVNLAKTLIKAQPDGNSLPDIEDSWQPHRWEEVLRQVREMRAMRAAPVDAMECAQVGAQQAGGDEPRIVRYQHLVALMLSSQTRDEQTSAAVDRLRDALSPTLTPETVVAAKEEELARLIYPVGFYKRKAKYLQAAAQICLDKYAGDVPRTIDDITGLPGVGPKMGHLLLHVAWDEVEGIGVDTHLHRLANMWRWVPRPTKTPEQTRLALEQWLPRELWREINPLLVGFGQTWCPSRSSAKLCARCLLQDGCPGATR